MTALPDGTAADAVAPAPAVSTVARETVRALCDDGSAVGAVLLRNGAVRADIHIQLRCPQAVVLDLLHYRCPRIVLPGTGSPLVLATGPQELAKAYLASFPSVQTATAPADAALADQRRALLRPAGPQ